MADEFADAIEEVHALLAPGPSLDGARMPAARKGLLRITHTLREYQQQVDLLMLRAIEAQRVENRQVRGDAAATRQAVTDLHARVDELEGRVEMLAALNDDLHQTVEQLRTGRGGRASHTEAVVPVGLGDAVRVSADGVTDSVR